MPSSCTIPASVVLFALVACAGQSPALPIDRSALVTAAPALAPNVTLRYIRPSAANAKVDPKYDAYDIAAEPATSKGRLFVFLPGSGATPSAYKLIVQRAVVRGFHAIGLEYPNGSTVDSLCESATSAACWGDVRNETITGENTSPLVVVAPVDSMRQRLTDLLTYLVRTDPTGGWKRYLQDGHPDWARIVVGGHSQGGGDAAFAAKLYPFDRACPIENPGDGNRSFPIAAWLHQPSKTAPAREFGFSNRDDELLAYDRVQPEWQAMHFPGPERDVDGAKPPYANSHQLYTVRPESKILESHGVTVADEYTPIGANGVPIYAPVWDDVCFGTN